MERLKQQMDFIKETENLKNVTRTAWTHDGKQESTAEHSYRLALLAGILMDEFPGLDREKVFMLCLVHDLGELYQGDISAALLPDPEAKYAMEKAAVEKLFALLPEDQREKLLGIWQEYQNNDTKEAEFVKALDKAETIMQHNQGENPNGFDYGFNLTYGREYFMKEPLLYRLREILEEETREILEGEM